MFRRSPAYLLLTLAVVLLPHDVPASDGITTLDVGGEAAHIVRDEFGTPHVFADTNSALFAAYGYVVAQDRLWQLEMNRRASQGRLAEIFGKQALSPDVLGVPDTATVTADVADQNVRTLGYTDDELDEQLTRLPLEQQEIFAAYVTGINRYLSESAAANPLANLPFEFHHLGLPVPEPWTLRDAVRLFVFIARLFGDAGGTERANQTLLTNLLSASSANGDPDPAAAALGMFNDVRWFNDPEAPASIPSEGAIGKRQHPVAALSPSQLAGASADGSDDTDERAKAALQALGIPTGIGSYGWTVSATVNTLLHALDDALREDGPCADLGGSCVPPSRDYTGLGRDGGPVLDPHFIDQLPLYQAFQYKPMPLYRNWVQRR